MPRSSPTISWQQLRVHCEQWTWNDRRTGARVTGFNPPDDAIDPQRKPFHLRYVTGKGNLEEGEMICLKVFPQLHQRMVQFTGSRQIRRVRDYLIISVNGIRVVTH